MLQWMGGSRRKVTTSRKSTQKRQKQYFEQRKRQQQQHLQTAGPESCTDGLNICRQHHKEHRSLDILNFLNLSTIAQKCKSTFPREGRDDLEVDGSILHYNITKGSPTTLSNRVTPTDSCEYEEARAPSNCQPATSSKKVLFGAPDNQNTAFNEIHSKPNYWKTVTEQQLSVLDLLCDDGPNGTEHGCPTREDHVAFSVEGLGQVGTETPVNSPQQPDRKLKLSKSHNCVLDDLELEVDTIMQDSKMPLSGSSLDFQKGMNPYSKVQQNLATTGDCLQYKDHTSYSYGSSTSQNILYNTYYSNEDIWDVKSSFLDDNLFEDHKYDLSWKKRACQQGNSSSDLLENGKYTNPKYDYEDPFQPKRRLSAKGMEGFNFLESPMKQSKHRKSDNGFGFFTSTKTRCSNVDDQDLISQSDWFCVVPEDVRDNSSLLSEESCSSTAVRDETIKDSPSKVATGEKRRFHGNDFVSLANNCSNTEGKSISMPNLSKPKKAYHSNYTFQEELGANNSWQFDEVYAPVDLNSGFSSCCGQSENKISFLCSKDKSESPISAYPVSKLRNKAKSSFAEMFAYDDLPVFSNVELEPTKPDLNPDFDLKGKPPDVVGFQCDTASPDLSAQESVSKREAIKVKLQPDKCEYFELREQTSTVDNGLFSENKMAIDASNAEHHFLEHDKGRDTTPEIIENSPEATYSSGHVEEASSVKIPDNDECKVERKGSHAVEIPLQCKTADKGLLHYCLPSKQENCCPEGRKTESKGQSGCIDSSCQVMMFESYVLQLLCVQKVLKEASMHDIKKKV
ncbi:hypothetical protein O6P43_020452 [Quillaja saponaria]|uniref:Uncharacterized protein n=1 Tax=Quillaja saponaria TaxID=32244 RepID=A0AAD7PM93_QUISA|nr:hypothetical protein O6P43_020452 [Quillaja saponaria]